MGSTGERLLAYIVTSLGWYGIVDETYSKVARIKFNTQRFELLDEPSNTPFPQGNRLEHTSVTKVLIFDLLHSTAVDASNCRIG